MARMNEVDLLDWLPAWTRALLDQRITAFVIAFATVVNVAVAWYIGNKTKEAADAAKASADAAKRSADVGADQAKIANAIYEASHRPYLAVSRIEPISFITPDQAYVRVVVRNYGALPLRFNAYKINFIITDLTKGQPHSQEFQAHKSGIVPQGEESDFVCSFEEKWLFGLARSDVGDFRVHSFFPYQSVSTKTDYVYTSIHRYNSERDWFEHVTSTMT
jgi:hypothetical protein